MPHIKKSADTKRSEDARLKLTPSEKQAINAYSVKIGKPFSEWARDLILREIKEQAIKELDNKPKATKKKRIPIPHTKQGERIIG